MNIVLTGASGGLGFEVAKNLLLIPNTVMYALGRSVHKMERIVAFAATLNNNSQLIPLSVDFNDVDEIKSVCQQIHFTSIDLVINNAGVLINKPIGSYTIQEIESTFRINTIAPYIIVQELMAKLNKGSHIVNIGSMGGVQGSIKFAGLSAYSASKGALAILTECMAEELRSAGVSVNCLALGAADTDMLRQAFPGYIAPVSAAQMGNYIAEFAINGHQYYNGKVLQVSLSTP